MDGADDVSADGSPVKGPHAVLGDQPVGPGESWVAQPGAHGGDRAVGHEERLGRAEVDEAKSVLPDLLTQGWTDGEPVLGDRLCGHQIGGEREATPPL